MTESLRGLGLHHVAVQTRDWERSIAFYRDLLGLRVIAEFADERRRYCLLEGRGGGCIELYGPSDGSPVEPAAGYPDPLLHIALSTRDTRSSLETVRAAGYEVTDEPVEFQAGPLRVTIAFFRGPNGEEIELIELPDGA